MSAFEGYRFSATEFSGTIRLFPVPNLVLFPHVMQPLRVFEPRYRDLLRDALRSDRLIAMAMLAPGWEDDYEGRPAIEPVACLGKVVASKRLDDGSFNLLLVGMRRVRLIRELSPTKRYREAEAEICEDILPLDQTAQRRAAKKAIHRALVRVLPGLPQAREQLEQLLDGELPLGVLTDVVAYALEMSLSRKEALLAEANVLRRAEMLLEHLSTIALDAMSGGESPACFPPNFSVN